MSKEEGPVVHMLSGASAGVIADGIMHPIDTIRARLQVQQGKSNYRGLLHAFSTIVQQEGWRALYKGFPIVVSATVPAHALYFGGYELSKKLLFPNTIQSEKGAVVHFLSGLIADISGALIWNPMDVIKQRLQIQITTKEGSTMPKYRGSFHALATIYREEGPLGLYRGFWTAIATYGPLVGIYFAGYEKLKLFFTKLHNYDTPQQLPFYYHLASGATAGAFAAAITCPLDVVKTRIQVHSRTNTEGYRTVFEAVKTVLKEEGARGFAKGMSARIMWIAPGNAITIAAYEQCKKFYLYFQDNSNK